MPPLSQPLTEPHADNPWDGIDFNDVPDESYDAAYAPDASFAFEAPRFDASHLAGDDELPDLDIDAALLKYYGFDAFRPHQREAVSAALSGRDTLVVMPTGAGKSLCFQLPALMGRGVTVVVSPLIALMHDQVDALNRRPSIAERGCACLTSLQSQDEQRTILAGVRSGAIRILYVAPERFRSGLFLDTLRNTRVARFVVDEAHCISEWGHDFRPDYLSLLPVIEALGRPPVMAVTATATTRVQKSIVANLAMRDPEVLVGGFNRPNLHYAVKRCKNEVERKDLLAKALARLSRVPGSGLIYVPTRKLAEEIGDLATMSVAASGQRAGMYHAGMDSETRTEMQSKWLSGELHVLVATSAFGMGIDKADVRYVIHYGYPDSLESYYQEAGRAGRDGNKSRCIILHCFTDRRTREWFLDNDCVTAPDVDATYKYLLGIADDKEARLPKQSFSRSRQWSITKLRLVFAELERANLISRVAETGDEMLLTLGPKPWSASIAGSIRADLDRQQRERRGRLNEMTDYCKTNNCRRRTVLSYFGDREMPPVSTFCCDNCEKPAEEKAERPVMRGPHPDMPAEIAPGDVHALLQGIDALRPAVGGARLDAILRGSDSKSKPLYPYPLFGALKGVMRDRVRTWMEAMISEGYLRRGDEDEYFVVTVTQAGRDTWRNKNPINVPPPIGPSTARFTAKPSPKSHSEPTEDDDAIFEALREWRRGEATARDVPPYVVMPDTTLREIAASRPTTLEDLSTTPGIGPSRLHQFGETLVTLVKSLTTD